MSVTQSQRPPTAHYMPYAAASTVSSSSAAGPSAALAPHANLPSPNVGLSIGESPSIHTNVNGGGSGSVGNVGRTSPRTSTSARSPHTHSGQVPNLPPTLVLAHQLSVQLQQAGGVRKHSKSAPSSPMHRPTRDLALGLAPLSTITPIDIPMAAASSVPNGSADPRLNGYHHGDSHSISTSPGTQGVASGLQHMSGLAPAAQIDAGTAARSPSHSPRTAPRMSPEILRPLSQLNHNGGGRHAPPQRGATIPPAHQVRPAPSYYSQADTEPGRRARRRAGSNPRPPSSASSDDTETEVDSDSTFVPGRMMRRGHSRSQPDLTALRSRLAENWATQQQEERREVMRQREAQASFHNNLLTRRRSQGRSRTPPTRPVALPQGGGTGSVYSSALPQGALGLRHSPRASTVALAHLTPITQSGISPRTDSSADDSPWGARVGLPGMPSGGMTGSEDADDDIGSTDSPSSGSLSFSPKRHRARVRGGGLVDRRAGGTALGLMLEPNSADERSSAGAQASSRIDLRAASIEARLRRSSLLNFRLLAVVPSLWGVSVLLTAMVNGALWHEVWPWGVDLSRDALERLVQGSHVYQGIERPIHRGDMLLAIAWALVTAHFCFSLTTGLSHRWRSYYSLPSTVTRLVSLQCLCWPATYITLWFLGPRRPLLAWVVIGVTTGWSRTVQMWVTSNVVDTDAGGDVTPGPRRSPPTGLRPPPPPKHVTGWRKFTYGRRWDWDAVAREVGYKVSALLLVTCMWLFWRIDGLETVPGDA